MLTIVVPGVLAPADAPAAIRGARLPALEKWLARADAERVPVAGAAGWLASAWGLAEPVPHAAVELAAADAPPPGTWMRADPVHLRVEGDGVVLHSGSRLDLTVEEAAALVAALGAHFRDDGLEFHAPAPGRWYVRVPEGEVPETTALEAALGRNVFGLLPRGAGRINWRSAITEAQMLLSTHAVNERREAEGRLAANSVWFWGGGALPDRVERAFATVYADDPFARGLAQAARVRSRPLPASLADVRPSDAGATLVVLDALLEPFREGDASRWLELALGLEAAWFAALGEAIGRFPSVRLVLPAEERTLVATLGRMARWRVLRGRRPLASHA